MKHQPGLVWLVPLVAVLSILAAGAGLFWPDGGVPYSFTTVHGQTVQMYGQGLYRYETYFKAPILRGGDVLTLGVCIPLLLVS